MTITAFKDHFFHTLSGEYPKEEIGSFFHILTQEYLGLSRLDIALQPHLQISPEALQTLESALGRLMQHEPIQYITGHTEFYGLNFKVNPHVLIPRPETEELVQWILEDHQSAEISAPEILDVGTGSGCIAVSLAKHLPAARVSAIEISEGALKTAKENASQNAVKVNFFLQDILKTDELEGNYDIIVSNPPYVRELEKQEMQPNVLKNEPAGALYVKDEDPLLFYEKIGELAKSGLNSDGKLYFEINQYLAKETSELLREKGFLVELRKDIFGNYRMLKAELKK